VLAGAADGTDAHQALGFHRGDCRGFGWHVRWHGRGVLIDENETLATELQNYPTFPRISSGHCRQTAASELPPENEKPRALIYPANSGLSKWWARQGSNL
jgi:hypothetical protein